MGGVGRWLEDAGVGEYADVFAENAIGWDVLPDLNDVDLEKLGIKLGDRKRILRAIAGLDADAATPAASQASDAERRQLTVMFCDLVGSTSIAERLDPEELREFVAGYQDAWKDVIERYDGFVARYMGDGILAYFGYPKAHEGAAEQAVLAGLGIIEAMASSGDAAAHSYGVTPAVRIGIATGTVVIGELGAGAALESAAFGETPNLTARLQGMAEPNSIVVSSGTRRLTAGQFVYGDLGERAAKGVSEPVRVWQVEGEGSAKSRFEARHGERITPIVGREEELSLLTSRWGRAMEGEGQVVVVTGEPGVGKSRICETFAARISEDPKTTIRYQCSPHHSDSALYPIIRQLEQATGIDLHGDAAERLDRLECHVNEWSEHPNRDVSLLAALLSIPSTGRYAPPEMEARDQKERVLDTLVSRLVSVSAQHPVLVLFEDLHWVDPSTTELLDRLVERIEELPVLLLVTLRSESPPPWTSLRHITPMALTRISKRESRAMLAVVAGVDSLPEHVVDEILAKTDGIPLFIEEMTNTVLDAKTDDDSADVGGGSLEVPASLQDSLMARLDRLSLGKLVAQTGAAFGRDFTEDLVATVCNLDARERQAALAELVERGILLTRGGSGVRSYSFKHALLQDAAYNSLLLADRKALHRRIVDELGERLSNQPSVLARHCECAGDLETAFSCRLKSGDQAVSQFANWEAVAQYWHALRLLEQMPDTEDRRRMHVDTVCRLVGVSGSYFWRDEDELRLATQHLSAALEASERRGDLSVSARLQAFIGEHSLDETLLRKAVDTAEAAGDARVQAEVASRNAGFFGKVGRYEDSHEHVRRAIEIYGELGEEVRQGLSMASHGRCYHARAGKLKTSLHYARRMREIAERTGNRQLNSWLAMESEPYLYKGEWNRTIESAEEGLPSAWELGNWNVVLFSSAWATIAHIKLGQLDAAQELMGRAMKEADRRATHDHPKMYPRIALSQLELALGNRQAAMSAAREAHSMAERNLHGLEKGAACRELARASAVIGDTMEAGARFRESLDVLGAIQCGPELAQSLLAYGRFKIAERASDGREMLERALGLFKAMGANGWVDETTIALQNR
ncbi:MAG: AAA family ATPase [Gammaproteobacteria bacterium]|nr:AAA family ATPase [Gammaproteobacteria bacterium]